MKCMIYCTYFSFLLFIFDSNFILRFNILRSRADKPAILISATAGVGAAEVVDVEGEGEGLFVSSFILEGLVCFVSKSASSTKSTK